MSTPSGKECQEMFKITHSINRLNEISLRKHNVQLNDILIAGIFLDSMQKRSLDCEGMLNCEGELSIGVKLGDVVYFTVLSVRKSA